MASNNTVDVLMKIRQVDKQKFEQMLKVQQGQQEIIKLEQSINNIRSLQIKAVSILYDSERKFQDTNAELENFHEKYNTLLEYVVEQKEIIPNDIPQNSNSIDELRQERHDLKDRLMKARMEKEDIAAKLNEIEIHISMEKKKNADLLLQLQKSLEVSLQEEKTLLDQLKNNI